MKNGQSSEYIRVATIQKTYDVSDTKLRQWANEGKLSVVRTPGGNRLYKASDIQTLFGRQQESRRRFISYCRVSSQHQKKDLARQVVHMQERFPDQEVIQDIGSGINFKKTGFQKLFQFVLENQVERITVTDKDRLCRFGYDLFEQICRHHKTQIVVLFPVPQDSSRELADDLLTIANVFVARNNGRRAARNRRERKAERSSQEASVVRDEAMQESTADSYE